MAGGHGQGGQGQGQGQIGGGGMSSSSNSSGDGPKSTPDIFLCSTHLFADVNQGCQGVKDSCQGI